MEQHHWFRVNPVPFLQSKREVVDGIEISVFPSPYDIPEAVRGYYDDGRKRFVIEFRYLSMERKERTQEEAPLTLHLGKTTGRIHSIEVDVDSLKAEAVKLNLHCPEIVQSSLDRWARSHNIGHNENALVASGVVKNEGSRLLAPLSKT